MTPCRPSCYDDGMNTNMLATMNPPIETDHLDCDGCGVRVGDGEPPVPPLVQREVDVLIEAPWDDQERYELTVHLCDECVTQPYIDRPYAVREAVPSLASYSHYTTWWL